MRELLLTVIREKKSGQGGKEEFKAIEGTAFFFDFKENIHMR